MRLNPRLSSLWLYPVGLLALAGTAVGIRYVYYFVPMPTFAYEVEATFDALPADDKALVAWLRGQPGVIPRTVCVSREGPDRKTVCVMFLQTKSLGYVPAFPDLEGTCPGLGYTGRDGRFRDVVSEKAHNCSE